MCNTDCPSILLTLLYTMLNKKMGKKKGGGRVKIKGFPISAPENKKIMS